MGEGAYLFRAMMDLSPLRVSEHGVQVVDWDQIYPFSKIAGPFTRQELFLIREMCVAYLEGYNIGENPLGKL
jgi:hypothetical protein